jgi:hypothetical protein
LYFRTNCIEISNLAVGTNPTLWSIVPGNNTPFFFLSPYYFEQEKKLMKLEHCYVEKEQNKNNGLA